MDPNTHSTGRRAGAAAGPLTGLPLEPPADLPPELPAELAVEQPHPLPAAHRPSGSDGLASLAAAVDHLASQDLDGLSDHVRAQRVLQLRRLLDRLEGHWLAELAGLDARGTAGADQGVQAASTASWLRNRLHVGAGAASNAVRTARALFRGPLTATAHALTAGELSVAHAAVIAAGTQELPPHTAMDAEPVLLEAARRLDPPRLRRVVGHLQQVADPDSADAHAERCHARRGLWLTPTLDGLVAVDGLLEAEAGQSLAAALDPLARPADAHDARSGSQRRADALAELARRALEGGRLPQSGGVRPQLAVLVDLDSLQGRHGAGGGEPGWAGPLAPEACRRLACDGAITRVIVSRHPGHASHGPLDGHGAPGHHDHPGEHDPGGHEAEGHDPGGDHDPGGHDGTTPHVPDVGDPELTARLEAALTRLPPLLGGAPSQPLDLGRTTRVVSPAQRLALAVRDGGCVFPDCGRPLAWCEGHHLVHWLDGVPPTWPTWPWSAGRIIGRCTRGVGGWVVGRMVGSPLLHRSDHPATGHLRTATGGNPPPPDRRYPATADLRLGQVGRVRSLRQPASGNRQPASGNRQPGPAVEPRRRFGPTTGRPRPRC